MPEGVGYGPQNTAAVGLNLNVIGKHAYAYSGSLDVTNVVSTLLEFTTGGTYLVGFFNIISGFSGNTNDDYLWIVYFNGVLVGAVNLTSSKDLDSNRLDLIIPPYTTVKVTCQNATDTSSHAQGAIITGRIYGKID